MYKMQARGSTCARLITAARHRRCWSRHERRSPTPMIDPAYALLIVSCAMLLFGAAAAHKLRSVGEFSQTLARYQLLPAGFIRIAGPALGLMELAICLGLPWPALRPVGAAAGVVLLLMYSAAITINLARGRHDLDCGCGGGRWRAPPCCWWAGAHSVCGRDAGWPVDWRAVPRQIVRR